ncbi:lipase secretion chaperone [Alkalilimnicola ehrlichii]|uniref:Uncharacterized protein n=1 Tax=Alkalilimnicola ehrlichii TaxID=351052 RepID=A0A3E0WSR7_9GAMM|nr:lipase secretion chaperone [Alkalilimnicola ehrlichii]RFA35439.1 hypothetical protein CAL65_13265 [Alkalilimnicola ehrlichii]
MAHASFLIERQFSTDKAAQVTALFRDYWHYRREKAAWRDRHPAPQTVEEEIEQFEALSRLQDDTLGTALAQRLYGEQRRMMLHMLEALEANAASLPPPE